MTETPGDFGDLSDREKTLLADLNTEYYALFGAVSDADGRLLTIKGWSVTLSLAGIGLGFQQDHYALFGLSALTALAFWLIEGLIKGHQMRHYGRMRDIEVAAFALNSISLPGLDRASAPRIDWSWGYRGQSPDWRLDPPQRRGATAMARTRFWPFAFPHVFLPHALAVVLGGWLFVAARMGADWLGDIPL